MTVDMAPKFRSRYDAAQTTDENKRHWNFADAMSARAANSPDVRRKLRNRSRYEADNDSYYGGLIRTVSGDLFGTGPTAQVRTDNDDLNNAIERRFAEWFDTVGLLQLALTASETKIRDGEAFLLLEVDDTLDYPVPLNLRGVEPEQVTTPAMAMPRDITRWVDGIDLDQRGRPMTYHVLRQHPGDSFANSYEFERIPARNVIHWKRNNRFGAYRGVPECTASLAVGAQRRRWSLATLTAAEVAADFAVLITSDLPPDFGDGDLPAEWESMPLNRGMITTLPAGGDAKQMTAQHPNQEYAPFKHELLKEQGRPLGAPYSITGLDGSEHNYSSLRYEREIYHAALRVERELCRRDMLDRIFRAWYELARMVPGYLTADISTLPTSVSFGWYWPGFAAIDPLKEAVSDTERLANCTTTLQELYAEYGQDWRVALNQRAREAAELRRLNLPMPKWLDPSAGNFGGQDMENTTVDQQDGEAPDPEEATARHLALSLAIAEAS